MAHVNFEQWLSNFFPIVRSEDDLPHVPDMLAATGDEFCASVRTDPEMVAAVCAAGFIPMGHDVRAGTGQISILLIKSHLRRSVLRFPDLHVSRSARRRIGDAVICVDKAFGECLERTVSAWPDRWLTESLCHSLEELHRRPLSGITTHSVELYSGDELIAGEIGYSRGGVYTSMSGFHERSGMGTVQLIALAALLDRAGFTFWDLGMDAQYKRAIGAHLVPRTAFLEMYAAATPDTGCRLPTGSIRVTELMAQG